MLRNHAKLRKLCTVILLRYALDVRGIVFDSRQGQEFFPRRTVEPRRQTHQVSYSVGSGDSFLGSTTTRVTNE